VFVSTYESAIDSKGRVSVPAPFRAALGGGSRIFLWPALDGSKCLEGGGEALMATYMQTISRLPLQSRERKALTAAIVSRSADLKMDDPGRIRIPDTLLAHAAITEKIVFVGAMDSFQVWNPDAYAAFETEMAEAAADPDVINALAAPYDAAIAAGGVPGLSLVKGEGE
jgi:MraZ protein